MTWSAPAVAKPAKEGPDDRPWGKGLLVPSFGLGGSFGGGAGSLFAGALSFGGGASYFVANGVAVGLSFNNDIRFFSQSARDDFPGIEENVPTYSARLTPQVTFIPFRSRKFSPYLRGGLGPVFFNNDGGVLGEWSVAVGGWIGIGKRAALDIGLGASQSFPSSNCEDAWSFTASNGNVIDGRANCGVFFYPRLGLVFAIQASPKGGRRSKKQRKQPATERAPAPTKTEEFAPPVTPVAAPPRPEPEPMPEPATGTAIKPSTGPTEGPLLEEPTKGPAVGLTTGPNAAQEGAGTVETVGGSESMESGVDEETPTAAPPVPPVEEGSESPGSDE
jgi:hypothetical protein